MEVWKTFDETYEVSNTGRVRSIDRITTDVNGVKYRRKGKILATSLNHKGYVMTQAGKLRSVHRMVALAFIPNPENKPQVNHKDGDKTNNHVDNLEWVSNSENIEHAIALGMHRHTSMVNVAKRKSKKVKQLDKNNNLIAIHPSINQASRTTGISVGNISVVANGKRNRAGGFIWEFV